MDIRNKKQKQQSAANVNDRTTSSIFQRRWMDWGALALFFILAWVWASWWMGDVFRISYERSFFALDATLMHFLLQQRFGWLWMVGRALLTLFRWPLLGGFAVALMLTVTTWSIARICFRSTLLATVSLVPACAWMWWTADVGLNLYYMHEPGRSLAVLFVMSLVCATGAVIAYIFRNNVAAVQQRTEPNSRIHSSFSILFSSFFILLCFAIPVLHLNRQHPYMRPLTRMQVQLLNNDYAGMSRTAHEHADMSYRQMAGYYVIALARTGHLADQLFDIKLEYDTIRAYSYSGRPSQCLNYHAIDCNYHAGLIRAARHTAMEELTMDGPTLFTLKILGKIALVEGDWEQARKYLHIINKVPFEGNFVSKYTPMVGNTEAVAADPEFAAILKAAPAHHVIENIYERPCFVGYYASVRDFDNIEQQTWSAMASLYSKRMPDFLVRCKPFMGSTPPRYIAEGLVTQAAKYPDILKAFPQLEVSMERFGYFLQVAQPYMKDRERGAEMLYSQFHGYYPYYYFFGNMRSTRKPADEEQHHKAGVN